MRIILYTGKGGTGKTSVAAATACRLAKEGKNVLIMSTDQAHSLKDSFEKEITNEETKVDENLYAMEIDAVEESEKAWGKMRNYLKEFLTSHAENGLHTEELLVFPGLEELFSLLKILEIKDNGRYDVLIVDCAPTGETLSLLRFPEMFGTFVRRFLPTEKKLVKLAGPAITKLTKIPMPEESIFDEIMVLTQRLERMQQVMCDKENVSLRIVTTPERIVIKEAKRNFTWLQLYDYNVDAVIVNRVYPPEALNGYFNKWTALQKEGLQEIEESFAPVPIYKLELKKQELKTEPVLYEAALEIFKDRDASKIFFTRKVFLLKKLEEGYLFQIYLPFMEKQDMEVTQNGGELIIRLQNETRRIMLPDAVRNKEVKRAKYEESGNLAFILE